MSDHPNPSLKKFLKSFSWQDVLGSQLIRRNDELALLYEKINIQQSILNKGEAQYQERLNDINFYKTKLQNLERKMALRY